MEASNPGRKPPLANVEMNIGMNQIAALFNHVTVRTGQSSSANGNCSARGLALLAAAMAGGGEVGGTRVLGQAGWDQLHAHPTKAEVLPDMQSNFTQGGVNKFEEEGGAGRDGYFGWFGYGGSVFQWNPELQVIRFTSDFAHILVQCLNISVRNIRFSSYTFVFLRSVSPTRRQW